MFSSYFLETLTLLNHSFTWFFLSRDRKAGGAGCGRKEVPLPQWARAVFPPRKTLAIFCIDDSFPCSSYETFLHSSLRETIRIPEGKAHETMGCPWDYSPKAFLMLRPAHTQPMPLIKIIIWVFWPAYGSTSSCSRWADIGCDSLAVFISRFRSGNLPCIVSSLSPRKAIGFPVVHLFLVMGMGVLTSMLFICQSWNWKSS